MYSYKEGVCVPEDYTDGDWVKYSDVQYLIEWAREARDELEYISIGFRLNSMIAQADKIQELLATYSEGESVESDTVREKLELYDEMKHLLAEVCEYNDHWGRKNYHRWLEVTEAEVKSVLARAAELEGK